MTKRRMMASGAALALAMLAAAPAWAQTSGADDDDNPAQINVRSAQSGGSARAILQARPFAETIAAQPVVRRLTMQQVIANPRIKLDTVEIDLTPMIARKGSLVSLAQRITARPAIAKLNVSDLEVVEVPEGLIVRTFINYQLVPGVCGDGRRGEVAALGLRCATRVTDATLTAAFSNPADPHYVANPRLRPAAIAQARAAMAASRQQIAADLATMRQQIAQPQRGGGLLRGEEFGEPLKLAAMSDEDLEASLANSGETKVEQSIVIPRRYFALPVFLKKPQAILPPKPKQVVTDTPLEPTTFLTGFTLAKDYEWQEKIEKTIKWCVIGCKRHYYAEVHAGFSYGLGLRFPIKLTGNYHYDSASPTTALVTANFTPFDGGPEDYKAAGLSDDKLFNGQEFVAQAEAHAGFSAHIPVYPDPPSMDFQVGTNFATQLTGAFAGGNFTPPAPGHPTAQTPFFFEDVDLLGDRLNFGFAGAKVFPGVEIGLQSNELTFQLHDLKSGGKTTMLSSSGQTVPVAVDGGQASNFTIGDPKYNISFVVTPGIDARLFVDIGVWSHNWDFPIWLDALKITLPPGGLDFSCHDGTRCERNFAFVTQNGVTVAGPKGIAQKQATDYFAAAGAKWLAKCASQACEHRVPFTTKNALSRVETIIDSTNWDNIAAAQAATDKINATEQQYDNDMGQIDAVNHGKV